MSELPVGQIVEEFEITERLVIDDRGVQLLLLNVTGYDGVMQGIAVENRLVDQGLVKKQDLYDLLAQEWLNINHGMIPQKKSVILPGGC